MPQRFRRPLHTYSIVAIDSEAGEMGVAVQSHWFSVGSVVSWAEAGAGVVATQAFANPEFGPRGLELMRRGESASEALEALLSSDPGRDFRQLALLDHSGRVAAFTGGRCIRAAGHETGEGFSVQANIMANDRIWPEMARTFRGSRGPLAERMLAALQAAQDAGGDLRGMQSAALLVVRIVSVGLVREDRRVDLRVDDHPQPLQELDRLLRVHQAYEHTDRGEQALQSGDTERALREYGRARELCPECVEIGFWHAAAYLAAGRPEEARPLFLEALSDNPSWADFAERLWEAGLLPIGEAELRRLLAP